jgi:hypothetical protein
VVIRALSGFLGISVKDNVSPKEYYLRIPKITNSDGRKHSDTKMEVLFWFRYGNPFCKDTDPVGNEVLKFLSSEICFLKLPAAFPENILLRHHAILFRV